MNLKLLLLSHYSFSSSALQTFSPHAGNHSSKGNATKVTFVMRMHPSLRFKDLFTIQVLQNGLHLRASNLIKFSQGKLFLLSFIFLGLW